MKILLVDDFEMVRMMLKNILVGIGYDQIDEAVDGSDALIKIKSASEANKPYDMVFCDWNMPIMSGLEVIESCRCQDDLKQIPIVMVTAESERAQIIKALKAGATDYIVKPVSPEDLEKKIQQILGRTNKTVAS